MKRITFLLVTAALLLALRPAEAQLKIAHINTNELIASMPEADSAQSQLIALNDELMRTGEELQVEYRKALLDYEQKLESLTPLVRKTKEDALTDMATRIQEFGNLSQQEYDNKRQELYQPILVKAQNAITEVADENGFDYVLDTAQGIVLKVPGDESLNILSLVQAKLGIKVN